MGQNTRYRFLQKEAPEESKTSTNPSICASACADLVGGPQPCPGSWALSRAASPGADLVGGAAAGEVAEVKVSGVLVQGRHAASWRGYYQLLITDWLKG